MQANEIVASLLLCSKHDETRVHTSAHHTHERFLAGNRIKIPLP